jgi:hypothetical protein
MTFGYASVRQLVRRSRQPQLHSHTIVVTLLVLNMCVANVNNVELAVTYFTSAWVKKAWHNELTLRIFNFIAINLEFCAYRA